MIKYFRIAYTIILFLIIHSQENNTISAKENVNINWLSFEQLEDSLEANPREVFVYFYADWCTLCEAMNETVFADKDVIRILNKEYYAVKFNVESEDTVEFGNHQFVNERLDRVNPIHQIPLLMAIQKNKPFSLPAMVFLDKDFNAISRYFQYIDKSSFMEIILANEGH